MQEQLRILKLKQEQDTNKPLSQSSPKGEEEAQKNGDDQEGEKKGNKTGEKKAGEEAGTEENDGEQSGEESKNGKEGKQNGESKGLSEETKKILEQKAKELQEQQGEIGKFYNKNYKQKQKSAFDNFADIFGRNQFDNGLLDDDEEKDW